MKAVLLLSWLGIASAFASPSGSAAEIVASVLGVEISREQLAAGDDETAAVVRLRDLVWVPVLRHYVAERSLQATAAEIDELRAYHGEFDRRDRAQRARKLEELNQRLARDGLESAERAWLEEFRAVLVRLAAQDAADERLTPPEIGAQARLFVEWRKANKALYEEYGGAVALSADGPVAHGARAALIADYERRGLVRFPDSRLREALLALLRQPPLKPVPPEGVDFTPYWKRPIPPSYYPD